TLHLATTLPTPSVDFTPLPHGTTLFPYTTLFRSSWVRSAIGALRREAARSADTHLLHQRFPAFPGIDFYFKDEAAHPSGSLKHRSEEHTSELQSRENLVCRLLPEKNNHNTLQPNY